MAAASVPSVRSPLDVVGLSRLMERTAGSPEVTIGLIDGPVAVEHGDLATENVRLLSPRAEPSLRANDAVRAHGTYVAGILSATRESAAPAICPGCILLVRPIFLEPIGSVVEMPSATPNQLADAIIECVDAGAGVLNLSVAVAQPSPNREQKLEQALDHAMRRGAIVVAAAGNQGILGSSAITRHSWVIPVTACDSRGWPLAISNLGGSIGRWGLMAPGEAVTSLGINGQPATSGGTSAAAPFVTGAIALLWSMFPQASAAEVRSTVTRANGRRASVVPPVLDAWAAYQRMLNRRGQR